VMFETLASHESSTNDSTAKRQKVTELLTIWQPIV